MDLFRAYLNTCAQIQVNSAIPEEAAATVRGTSCPALYRDDSLRSRLRSTSRRAATSSGVGSVKVNRICASLFSKPGAA